MTTISQPIPTNIITGFLGAGKTTLIQHLLEQKPQQERWAILINEFGEIGIDGSLLAGQHGESKQVYIREVPGGCMCCASGLPMQIALNQLISRAKPDRLLIEPTGLGHPKEVLEVFASEHYRPIIDLRATLTLVDARKIADPRYSEHATFLQQLDVADVLVASKSEQYGDSELEQFKSFLDARGMGDKPVEVVSWGKLDPASLDLASDTELATAHQHSHAHQAPQMLDVAEAVNENGYTQVSNQGEGFESCGWAFSANFIFSFDKIYALLSGLPGTRLKAVVITEKGVFGFNRTEEVLTCLELDDADDSRIEIIDTRVEGAPVEQALLESVHSRLA